MSTKIHELKLNQDLIEAARFMQENEARYLVDCYYIIQEHRKAASNQHRSSIKQGEPAHLVGWIAMSQEYLEDQIKKALDGYTESHEIGRWAKSICGIGPVISAGLMAYIDIERAPTAGHIWSYAGLVPGQKREKGKKINWNPDFKTLCWKIGEGFVKVSNNEKSFYGKMYKERKKYEQENNERGEYADQAAYILEHYNYGKDTEAYKYYSVGKLPPAHIHARAKRWTVKLFLAHFHEKLYKIHYGENPPNPYPIDHLGHVHWIKADEVS